MMSLLDEKTSEIRERQDETLDHHENIIENLHILNDTIAFILKVSDRVYIHI